MNEKFFTLPEEKRHRIINAGFRVFSKNSYRKSPVGDIAREAGISKSLLFHYFRNKRELYMFLWSECARITKEAVENCGCFKTDDMFDAMFLVMKAKFNVMRTFPDLGTFAIKSYYEEDPEVSSDVASLIKQVSEYQLENIHKWFRPELFVQGIDIRMMYRDMYLASEGFIWEKLHRSCLDADEMEKEFCELIEFWKSIYLRRETNECNRD